jgi:hypothetical protein
MAGMLQIITYLLCVYLVFKGIEILQIGLMTSNPERARTGKIIGVVAVVISVLVAAVFVLWIDLQAGSLSDNMMGPAPSLR